MMTTMMRKPTAAIRSEWALLISVSRIVVEALIAKNDVKKKATPRETRGGLTLINALRWRFLAKPGLSRYSSFVPTSILEPHDIRNILVPINFKVCPKDLR